MEDHGSLSWSHSSQELHKQGATQCEALLSVLIYDWSIFGIVESTEATKSNLHGCISI